MEDRKNELKKEVREWERRQGWMQRVRSATGKENGEIARMKE